MIKWLDLSWPQFDQFPSVDQFHTVCLSRYDKMKAQATKYWLTSGMESAYFRYFPDFQSDSIAPGKELCSEISWSDSGKCDTSSLILIGRRWSKTVGGFTSAP
jgi:hypothetical protein